MREFFPIYLPVFIWSALALVLFVRKVTVYQGFIQYIKAGNKEVSDIKILNLLPDENGEKSEAETGRMNIAPVSPSYHLIRFVS